MILAAAIGALLSASGLTAGPLAAADTLTTVLTVALDEDPRLEVMSSADLRRVMTVEAEKQALGCDVESDSCLAELAGAMGARLVVFAQLSQLEDSYLLSLAVFDSNEARVAGRRLVRAQTVDELSRTAPDEVRTMMQQVSLAAEAEAPPVRALVLDVEAVAGVEPAAAADPGMPWMLVLGGTAVGISALALATAVVAGGFAIQSHDEASRQSFASDADNLYDQRDSLLIVGGVAGGAGLLLGVGGGALLALDLLGGGE